jgi:hypothetical protein
MNDTPEDAEKKDASVSEFREYARGQLPTDHRDVHPHAALVDDEQLSSILSFAASNYQGDRDDLPHRIEETRWYRQMVRAEATEVATRAVRDGDSATISYMTGDPNYDPDISGLKTIHKMEDWLRDSAAKMVYIVGHMGSGKTDFSLLMVQVLKRLYDRDSTVENYGFSSNILSDDLRYINDYDELEEWFTTGSSDDRKWYIFDEASSQLSGYQRRDGAENVEEKLSGLIKKMRKNGCNLIVIGHTGRDVHPDIRRLCDIVLKRSQKRARICKTIKESQDSIREVGHMMTLEKVPPTDLHYNTEDEAEFTWGDGEDGEDDSGLYDEDDIRDLRDARICDLYDQGVSQSTIAEAFDIAQSTVSNITPDRDPVAEATNRGGAAADD